MSGAAVAIFDGLSMFATISVGRVSGTGLQIFSFDPSFGTCVFGNVALSGGTFVTVSGLAFGLSNSSSSAVLNGADCWTSSWTAATSVSCRARTHMDTVGYAVLTVAGLAGTGTRTISFDVPVVSGVNLNAVFSGQGSVSVAGLSFGAYDSTVSSALEGSVCSTTAWNSLTSLGCLSIEGKSADGYAGVTVGAMAGTGSNLISFDGMCAMLLCTDRSF
jgi:hypothetical protein